MEQGVEGEHMIPIFLFKKKKSLQRMGGGWAVKNWRRSKKSILEVIVRDDDQA